MLTVTTLGISVAPMSEITITRVCEICTAEFSVIPSRMKHGRGKHCSPACQYEARRRAPKVVVAFACIGCGVSFTRFPSVVSKAKGSGKFCTRQCRDLNWKGAVTPNWIDGAGVYKRGPHWYAIRRRVKARDGNACVECGAAGTLHVHHKTPFRKFSCEVEANADENLITLCPPCHRRADAEIQKSEKVHSLSSKKSDAAA